MEPIIEKLIELTQNAGGENYYEKQPPELNQLLKKLDRSTDDLREKPRHKFTDLYEEKKDYYERRNDVFNDFYNTTVKRGKALPKEVVGLYTFFQKGKPIYVGNSRSITQRLRQHFLGKDHYSSSLVYLMARTYWEYTNKNRIEIYEGERKSLPDFDKNRELIQEDMRENWEILILPMPDPYERYLSEVYYAMHFKTYWNNFDTH